jgi:hypothetical protein
MIIIPTGAIIYTLNCVVEMQAVSPVVRTTEVSLLLHAEVLSNFTSEMPTRVRCGRRRNSI